jgi:Nucleotidyltransferase substrate binding protein like
LSDLERQGLIQAFGFTHELAWNLMQDGEAWMEMIKSRNQSSHTYNLDTALEIAKAIDERYWTAFRLFFGSMELRALGS